MQPHGPGEGQTLRVAAFADQILHLVTVTDVGRGLLDDRAVVEIFGDVVGRGTDQLHPPLPSTVVRLRPLEGRQKRVVNIDHRGETAEEIGTEHLHVLGQHGQFDAVLLQQRQHAGLGLGLGGGRHRHASKGHAELLAEGFQVGVVRHHERHLHGQFTTASTPKQIQQAMALLAGEDRHPRQFIRKVKLGFSPQPLSQGMGRRSNRLAR